MFERKALKEIQPQLQELEKEMTKISGMTNKVEAIIKLFQVISTFQDAGGFRKLVDKLNGNKKYFPQLEAAMILQDHIKNAGRCPYGMNRTHEGEEVTAENVFLGDIAGLWTKTASFWLARERDGAWGCISCQAEKFVKSHVDGILKQIVVLRIA